MSTLSPLPKEQWNSVMARHLLNRAGFGVPDALVEKLAGLSPEEAVNLLVDYEDIPSDFMEPDFLAEPFLRNQYRKTAEDMSEDELREVFQQKQREEREAILRLKVWWLQRMVYTPRPLEEKMTLFWHGHFAVSAQKVKYSEFNHEYYAILRANATGNFKALTTAIGQSRAMLDYLDNRASTKEHPNENWARELMELFTMGVGTYTENDIKESARAFTGWWHNGDVWQYRLVVHDFDKKEFLGRQGSLDGWDILDIIFEQPVCAEFICRKLCAFFMMENPDSETVNTLAETLRANNYEIKPVLRQLFQSERFYRPEVMASQIKSPAQLVVQLAHHLELQNPPWLSMAKGMQSLGQDIFHPPNVKGWEGNRAWINANAMLLRYNLPMQFLSAEMVEQDAMMAMLSPEDGEAMDAMPPESMDIKEMSLDKMDYEKAAKKSIIPSFREAIQNLPRREQREYRDKLKAADPMERRQLLRELGVQPPANAVALEAVFAGLTFKTAGDCVQQVTMRMLPAPISQAQREALVLSIGASSVDTPLTPEQLCTDNRRALLHLITSMAEYQLC